MKIHRAMPQHSKQSHTSHATDLCIIYYKYGVRIVHRRACAHSYTGTYGGWAGQRADPSSSKSKSDAVTGFQLNRKPWNSNDKCNIVYFSRNMFVWFWRWLESFVDRVLCPLRFACLQYLSKLSRSTLWFYLSSPVRNTHTPSTLSCLQHLLWDAECGSSMSN